MLILTVLFIYLVVCKFFKCIDYYVLRHYNFVISIQQYINYFSRIFWKIKISRKRADYLGVCVLLVKRDEDQL